MLGELGLRRKKKEIVVEEQEPPQNKYWLHDTPGAINDAQVCIYRTSTIFHCHLIFVGRGENEN